jgi:D-3-phosphoglycerate dehydrogenase
MGGLGVDSTFLEMGKISGAGLDVWSPELPARDNPLLLSPNVTVTWHTAGVTHEARRNAAMMAADQIETILRGVRPPRIINPAVWPVYLDRFKRLFG